MMINCADLQFNTETNEVARSYKKISLTKQETNLLRFLLENPNKIVSRQEILNYLWNTKYDVKTRIVDVYIGYLRKKIDGDSSNQLIKTIHGKGYILVEREFKA